ncbi:MAG: CcmD family protein [Capsulimonadales bacterium]|nr:CcmD family protein [Capsulimonadales bacterium]
MLPLLIVALLIWAGVFAFTFRVDQRLSQLENRFGVGESGKDRE